jgi:hypothetical protein
MFAPVGSQVGLQSAVTGRTADAAPARRMYDDVRHGTGAVRPRIHRDGMKRLVSIGLVGLLAVVAIAGATSSASASASPGAAHRHHHRALAARHDAALASPGLQTDGGRQPARRHNGTSPRHRATVPSLGHTARAQRQPRADGRSLAAVREVTTAEARDAAMVRASEPREAVAAVRQVGSGRAPPRAGPSDDSEPPPAPRRASASTTPTVQRSAVSLPAAPAASRPSPRLRAPRLRREAFLAPAVPAVPPAWSLVASSVVPMRSVPDRLPACRPEGTAAGSFRPS